RCTDRRRTHGLRQGRRFVFIRLYGSGPVSLANTSADSRPRLASPKAQLNGALNSSCFGTITATLLGEIEAPVGRLDDVLTHVWDFARQGCNSDAHRNRDLFPFIDEVSSF